MLDGEKSGPGKRVRGLGAIACARHGCFCPSSVVDFPKGEKQMHMDYALSETAKTTNITHIHKLALIYDIMCEYGIHLETRFLEQLPSPCPTALKLSRLLVYSMYMATLTGVFIDMQQPTFLTSV